MEQLKPEEIKRLLFDRLAKDNKAYIKIKETLKNSEEYEEYFKEIMYFKYYFDFSSAIEEINRNILYCKYKDDSYSLETQRIEQPKKPMFIKPEHEVLLINNHCENKTIGDIKDFYYKTMVLPDNFYKRININKKIYEYEKFASFYGTSENTRNMIAHGLKLQNVKYDDSTLFKFMMSFYTIYIFYEDTYNEKNK